MQTALAIPTTPLQPQSAIASSDDLGEKRRKFRAYEQNKKREQDEAQVARRYYHGKQWSSDEIAKLNRRGQPPVWDNRIGRKIDFLVGVEQRMRRDPKGYPRTPADEKSADTATAGLRFVCDLNRWEHKASDGAHDGMVSGIGVMWVGIEDGSQGPDVKLKVGQVDRFFYDPRSVLPDFSDARYMGMHLWVDIDDAVAEYPDQEEELRKLVDRNGGLSLMKVEEDRDQQWGDFEHSRIRLVEMYEKKLHRSELMQSSAMTPARVTMAWYYCKFSGDVKLDSMWSPYLDEDGKPDCPYVAWSPYIDEKGDRYGLIRNMLPMQDEINHRRSKLLHRLNARPIHMREGVVDDVDDMRNQLARVDGVVKHTGTWGEDIGLIDQTTEIKGEAELLAQAQASLENLGPNPGLIGKGGGVADQSGRAILAQRDSGMTELSPVFERLRDWKLRVYRKIWARMKQAWTGERWIRITDKNDAPKFLGINQYGMDPTTGMATSQNVIAEIDVDIILDEGPDTITMREELMQTFAQLGEAAAGPMGKVMIELSNVSDKEQLIAMIDQATAPPPQVVEMEARMAKLEEMLKASQIDSAVAEVENKRADTMAKLAGALQPKEQQIHKETGMPMGPPPADPMQSVMGGLNALQMFPLQYGQPTVEQMAMQAPIPQAPPPDDQGMQPPMGGPMPPGASGQEMIPPEQQMPGGLPISPEAGAI